MTIHKASIDNHSNSAFSPVEKLISLKFTEKGGSSQEQKLVHIVSLTIEMGVNKTLKRFSSINLPLEVKGVEVNQCWGLKRKWKKMKYFLETRFVTLREKIQNKLDQMSSVHFIWVV